MSKFKAYRGPKKEQRAPQNAWSCMVLIAIGLIVVALVFYYGLQPG
jgi:hypothetical protein